MHPHREISDLTLEQYALGELPVEKEARVRAALEKDAALQARLAALQDSDRQILADYPAARMAAAIRERQNAGQARRPGQDGEASRFTRLRAAGRTPFAFALPAAAAVLLFLSFMAYREGVLPQMASSMSEVTRMKGARPHLSVYRKTTTGAEQLAAGQPARQRDVLQISYTAADARFGVILSLDGRGTVTWHLPPVGAGVSFDGALAHPAGGGRPALRLRAGRRAGLREVHLRVLRGVLRRARGRAGGPPGRLPARHGRERGTRAALGPEAVLRRIEKAGVTA